MNVLFLSKGTETMEAPVSPKPQWTHDHNFPAAMLRCCRWRICTFYISASKNPSKQKIQKMESMWKTSYTLQGLCWFFRGRVQWCVMNICGIKHVCFPHLGKSLGRMVSWVCFLNQVYRIGMNRTDFLITWSGKSFHFTSDVKNPPIKKLQLLFIGDSDGWLYFWWDVISNMVPSTVGWLFRVIVIINYN